MTISHWDQRYIEMARLVSTWSKDPSTQVGAIVARADHTLVSAGMNGFPRGTNDYHEYLNNREVKLRRTVHAEINAIITAGQRLDGCTLYVTPLHPCATCAGIIIQSGIKHVVAELAKEPKDDWAEDFREAARMFKEAGVTVELLTPGGNS